MHTKKEDINSGRATVQRDDARQTSVGTIEWRYDSYANHENFAAVIQELSALDSLSFEALDKLRSGQ